VGLRHQYLGERHEDAGGRRLEVLAERRFGTKLERISRLLSIDEVALAAAARMGRPAAK